MRVVFAGGGTGGHINPAISIANYIKKKQPDFQALFIGTPKGLESKLVPAAGYDIQYIDIMGFNRKDPIQCLKVAAKLFDARAKAKSILERAKPDVVVATGGYACGPVVMAAHSLGIPAIIHEQNVYPGLTVKGSQRYVDYVAISFDETKNHLKKSTKCILTGNPVREEILKASQQTARERLGLSEKPFVLVFGGSLGADRINRAVVDILNRIVSENKIQLMFATGERNHKDITSRIKKLGISASSDVRIVPYINNMHEVMAAADLVVARSGAITLSEIAALGKASILIPSPNVVRNHQEQNAREFEKLGAAVVITEDVLGDEMLYNEITRLTSDKTTLSQMGQNARKLAKIDALEEFYSVVMKLAATKDKKR